MIPDEALVTLRHSSDLLRGSELPRWVALALVPLAHAYLDAGDQAKAIDCLEEATRVASAADTRGSSDGSSKSGLDSQY